MEFFSKKILINKRLHKLLQKKLNENSKYNNIKNEKTNTYFNDMINNTCSILKKKFVFNL